MMLPLETRALYPAARTAAAHESPAGHDEIHVGRTCRHQLVDVGPVGVFEEADRGRWLVEAFRFTVGAGGIRPEVVPQFGDHRIRFRSRASQWQAASRLSAMTCLLPRPSIEAGRNRDTVGLGVVVGLVGGLRRRICRFTILTRRVLGARATAHPARGARFDGLLEPFTPCHTVSFRHTSSSVSRGFCRRYVPVLVS